MLQNLRFSHPISDFISVGELGDLSVLVVRHPKASAVISLFGGHILSFQPNHSPDLLWLSEHADLSGKTAIRGGIPICWPWFGKAATPSHGFARQQEWSLDQHRENEEGVMISLTLEDNSDTRKIWDVAFQLELQIEVNDSLTVRLITTNTDSKPFELGGALHTYFAVEDITKTTVTKVGQDFISASQLHTVTNDSVIFEDEVDRIYTNAENTIFLNDKSANRKIHVSNSGHNAVVVWNPWKTNCGKMRDMPNDGYLNMVCVESAIYDQSVTLLPSESHTLSTTLHL